jgi:hypothetical protein
MLEDLSGCIKHISIIGNEHVQDNRGRDRGRLGNFKL